MESKKDLWLRLRNYHFDHLVPPHLLDHVQSAFGGPDASTRAFADKLARKLGWSVPFALRAVDEYRKFVYLGQVAEFPVTPPKVIDQVWHEHLLFTRAYREFCDHVLRREFDHHPELVPRDEQTAAFQSQYAATLDLYHAEFDREPPAAFWGVPKFVRTPGDAPAKRRLRRRDSGAVATSYDDTPLYAYFPDSGGGGDHGPMPEFGGGASGGGGGGGAWSDSTSHGGHGDSGHGGHDGGGDSGGGDGGSGGGGDGGGSGCSSGCGGGGCGSS